jgi:hypothetical protein
MLHSVTSLKSIISNIRYKTSNLARFRQFSNSFSCCRGDRHQLNLCVLQEIDLLQTSVEPEIILGSFAGDLFIITF